MPGFAGKPLHHLYLAAVPAPDMNARMGCLSREIGAGGEFRKLKLHMSVLSIAHTPELDLRFIDRLREVIGGLTLPAFEVTFDRFMTFGGEEGKQALVFAPAAPGRDLSILSSVLERAIFGKGRSARRHPHVTASYGPAVPTIRLEEPIHWPVRELVLIDNWIGLPRYDRLARWDLKPGLTEPKAQGLQAPRGEGGLAPKQLPLPGLFD